MGALTIEAEGHDSNQGAGPVQPKRKREIVGPYFTNKAGAQSEVECFSKDKLDCSHAKIKVGRDALMQFWKVKDPDVSAAFPDVVEPVLDLDFLEREGAELYYALAAQHPDRLDELCEYKPFIEELRETRIANAKGVKPYHA